MKLSNMENLIFSYAYYKIADFDKLMAFFAGLQGKEMFSIEKADLDKKILSGAFIRPYPKNHWNPLAKSPNARQVMGNLSAKGDNLKLEAMTKSGLKTARDLIESELSGAVIFEREEYKDPLERFRG
ncbi:hypothetical protein HYX00_06475 [Candidatus Woesearchaeota archaeon]|nr:hypothetical protein [Candidatus Woesearchaeota archaeon]